MAELADNGLNRKIVDAATVAKEVDALEAEIAELRAAYDQFFIGIERRPPSLQHQALKKKIIKVKGAFVRQTAIKFRINMVQQKFASYERLWARTMQEIENGTYRRDLFRAKLHKKDREEKQQKPLELTDEDVAESLEDVLSEVEITAPAPVAAKPLPPPKSGTPIGSAPVAKPGTPGPVPAVARPGTPGPVAAVAKPGTPGPVAAVATPATVGAVPAARPGTPGPLAAAPKPGAPAAPGARPATPASAAAAARPSSGAAPAVARPAGAPPAAAGGGAPLSEQKLRAVYDAYVTAKKRCQEDTSKLSYDQVAANLRKQVPELMKKSGAASVEFKIVIKDGKAVLKAIPK